MSMLTYAETRDPKIVHFTLHGWVPVAKGQLFNPVGHTTRTVRDCWLFCSPRYCGFDSHGQEIFKLEYPWDIIYTSYLERLYEFHLKELR